MINYDEVIALVKQTDSLIFDEEATGHVLKKGMDDYVTYVDLGVQHFLKKELHDRYPDIAFMGEEEGETVLHPEGLCWILDPIDGTTNLIHHMNLSAVSLGLWDKGRIVFGVVYNPFTKETFSAVRGQGAYYNGKPIRTSTETDMKKCLISFGSSPYDRSFADRTFEIIKNIYLDCREIRRLGAASLDLCYIAAGKTEGYYEMALKPWDYAAGSVILEEAGGIVTTMEGEPLAYEHGGSILAAANGTVYDKLKEYMKL